MIIIDRSLSLIKAFLSDVSKRIIYLTPLQEKIVSLSFIALSGFSIGLIARQFCHHFRFRKEAKRLWESSKQDQEIKAIAKQVLKNDNEKVEKIPNERAQKKLINEQIVNEQFNWICEVNLEEKSDGTFEGEKIYKCLSKPQKELVRKKGIFNGKGDLIQGQIINLEKNWAYSHLEKNVEYKGFFEEEQLKEGEMIQKSPDGQKVLISKKGVFNVQGLLVKGTITYEEKKIICEVNLTDIKDLECPSSVDPIEEELDLLKAKVELVKIELESLEKELEGLENQSAPIEQKLLKGQKVYRALSDMSKERLIKRGNFDENGQLVDGIVLNLEDHFIYKGTLTKWGQFKKGKLIDKKNQLVKCGLFDLDSSSHHLMKGYLYNVKDKVVYSGEFAPFSHSLKTSSVEGKTFTKGFIYQTISNQAYRDGNRVI